MRQLAVSHAVNPGLTTFFSNCPCGKKKKDCVKALMKGADENKLSKERRNRGVGDEW